ncbi:MAG: Rieske 2Fe-2S domain-containing protein [Blastocatellia bacterium]|nr:Rieske 2Fe-2S domain-containing protein [Blastocatellia bacterium]
MDGFVKALQMSEIIQGRGKIVILNGHEIAVLKSGEKVYALDNSCPHKGGPLGEGVVMGNMVICPWHGWPFDVNNGHCSINPRASVSCYEVKIEGDDIFIKL